MGIDITGAIGQVMYYDIMGWVVDIVQPVAEDQAAAWIKE